MATLENNVSEQIQFNFTYYAMKLLGRNLYQKCIELALSFHEEEMTLQEDGLKCFGSCKETC